MPVWWRKCRESALSSIFIDETELRASALVFATLINMRADTQNHVSHMVITRAERDELVGQIERAFGDKLNAPDDYAAGQAVVLRTKLKEFKCADDPW
jgi:hypothetical protein